jgi:3,4-dihydroxy-2-butanone 4-phosphate synthase
MDRLKLPLMVTSTENDESMYTAFTVTVDLRKGTSTGISAADRAATLRAMADPASHSDDFRRPGHIFPLRYRQGGVIVRPGHTEAAVDLARASGANGGHVCTACPHTCSADLACAAGGCGSTLSHSDRLQYLQTSSLLASCTCTCRCTCICQRRLPPSWGALLKQITA